MIQRLIDQIELTKRFILNSFPVYFVYVIFDTRKPKSLYHYANFHFEYQPIYVGISYQDERMSDHLWEAYSKKDYRNPFKCRLIRKIKSETGSDPVILKYKIDLTQSEAKQLEREMILTIGRYNLHTGPLVNDTDGGEGCTNPSPETRQRISKANRGKKRNAIQLENIAKSQCKYSYRLIDSEGNEHVTNNLKAFCRTNNLDDGNMDKVIKGKVKSCNGWIGFIIGKEHLRDRYTNPTILYFATDPNGNRNPVFNLAEFCRQNSLNLMSVRKEVRKQGKYKGWLFVKNLSAST